MLTLSRLVPQIEEMMNLTEIKAWLQRKMDEVLEGFEALELPADPEPALRAISISDIATQASQLLWDAYPDEYYWIGDIVEDNGSLYGILSRDGRLWRTLITVNGSEVSISPLEQVEINYTPVSFRSNGIKVIRQADGTRYWMRIVSAAVLLRGAKFEIDSTALMDSFIENINRTGVYPIAAFWHTGEATRIGETIELWRDEKMLCDVGRFDDTPFAQAIADSVEDDPDYWGTSIEYYDDEDAAIVERMAGVPVIIHRKGVLTSCDFLPQDVAASLFTGGIRALQRGKMFTTEQKEALKKKAKLSDDDISGFESEVRSRNIEAGNMISREATPAEEEPAVTLDIETAEIELTDEAIAEIGDALAERFVTVETIAAMQEEIVQLRTLLTTTAEELVKVRGVATTNDETRRKAIAATMPKSPSFTIVGRGKTKPEPEEEDEEDDEVPEVLSAHKRTVAPASAAAQFFAASKKR